MRVTQLSLALVHFLVKFELRSFFFLFNLFSNRVPEGPPRKKKADETFRRFHSNIFKMEI